MISQEISTQPSSEENTPLSILKNRTDKEKLLEDIMNLKALRADVKLSLEYYRTTPPFSETRFVNDEEKSFRLHKIPDAIGIINDELYRYAGINCTKFDKNKECIFEFNSFMNGAKNETYFVQILMQKGKGKLGFWKMPLLLNATEILSNCPVDDLKQVKHFVRLCKHYLDCRKNRQTQFEKFKAHVQVLHSCSVQTNPEIYTNVQLHVFKLREIETDNFYDILLYIVYKLNETRPIKLIPDSLHEDTLPEEVIGKLNVFFKNFMLLELQPSFEKIFLEENGKLFQWEQSFKDKDLVTKADEVDSDLVSEEKGNELEISEIRSFTNEKENKKSGRQKEKMDKGENPTEKKILKKMDSSRELKISQSGANKKIEKIGNFEVTRKVRKIRFEENNNQKREYKLEATKQGEKNEEMQIIKKIPRKVKSEVFKIPKNSGKQTKQNFLKNNNNIEKTENLNSETKELEEKEVDEEKIDEGTDQTQNPKKNIESKECVEENSMDQNKNRILSEEKGAEKKNSKDQNTNQILSEEKGAEKKNLRRLQNKSIKKTFDLSNFVLKRKKSLPLNKGADLLEIISPRENIATSSTPIAGQKRTPVQMDTEISEIIKVNKPIHKSLEKRPRSDSSDSDLEEVVEEPDKSLLKNLEEVQEKIVKISSGNRNKKGKKSTKRVKIGNKKNK